MLKTLKQAKRRLEQTVLAKLDLAEHSDDQEFELMFSQFAATEQNLRQLEVSLGEYAESIKAMQLAAGKVAASVIAFYDQDAPQREAVQQWVNLQYRVHDKLSEQLYQAVSKEAREVVAAHVALYPQVDELVEKRGRKLVDVDAYRRQLRAAQEKKKAELGEVQRKEEKLRLAETVYVRINGDLTRMCAAYETYRRTMLNQTMATLAQAQCDFFRAANDGMAEPLEPLAARFSTAVDSQTTLAALTTAFAAILNEDLHTENLAAEGEGSSASLLPLPLSAGQLNQLPLPVQRSPRSSGPDRILSPPVGGEKDGFESGVSAPLARNVSKTPFQKPFAERHREMAPPLFVPAAQPSPAEEPDVLRVTAQYDYQAQSSDELSFAYGDVITVVSKDPSGWWQGELRGVVAAFPANYTDAPQ